MSTSKLSGLCGAIALALMLPTPAAHADHLRYGYVALDQTPLPAPYAFFAPVTVSDGRVYGTVFDESVTVSNVAVYKDGTITIGPSGSAFVANAAGTIGGEGMTGQAALFRHDVTTLVPALPGQAYANVIALGDNQLALVQSVDSSFVSTYAYFHNGTVSAIDFGVPPGLPFNAFMNETGLVGLTNQNMTDYFWHGYRYDPHTRTSTPLPPFSGDPTDVNVLIQGVNARGDVLGYSFTDFASANYHERVGVWNHHGVFQPYFFQTLNTSTLLFNDRNDIVITNSADGNSYLVPTPGTRLDLASLVANLPAGLQLTFVVSIDNDGNMIGYAADESFNFFPFMLVRLNDRDSNPGHAHVRCPVPSRIVHGLHKEHSKR